ncbi:hypothetical protein QIS99_28835 [Streptomyces sp. B-S-A8]|uniref:Uncharacterized protein n=1 Tax=Streptomyces solicavernae TaxID=3043614 RepID=A0ABT6S0E1_9ACTN|nr:hypothetical protein [Streptomyces sp. B-S-A8]MDI3390167.1 hypothetical protein [Streptomyces sp. B-S-A8]
MSQRMRLALAGRRAVVVGLLMMMCVPLTGTAQAAPVGGMAPTAVSAPMAPEPVDPCEDVKGPAKAYCEDGRDNSPEEGGTNTGKDDKDKPKDDPCDLLDKDSAQFERCRSGESIDPLGLMNECKAAPEPEVPGTGVTGWFDSGPKEAPKPRDPASKDADAYIYEQYGYAGLTWNTYDLGCGGGLRAPEASSENMFANLAFSWSRGWTSLTVVLRQFATSDALFDELDPIIERATRAVRDAVYSPWIGTSLLLLGIVIIWQARKQNVPDIMQRVAWALMVMTVATAVASYPVAASQFADEAIDTTVAAIDQGIASVDLNGSDDNGQENAEDKTGGVRPAGYAQEKITAGDPYEAPTGVRAQDQTAHGNMLVHHVLYQEWLRGVFGDNDSKVAQKYGMQLLDAQALTWREARLPTDERREVVKEKKDQFAKIAEKVKAEDPTAYGYLTGKTSGRLGAGGISNVQAAGANSFSMIADVIITVGKLMIRLLVIMFPAIAVIGLHRGASNSVKTAFGAAMAACINIPLFAVGAGVQLLIVRELADESVDLPSWAKALVMILTTVVLWKMLRPLARLTSMVNPNRNYLDDGAGAVTGPGKAARQAGKYYLGTRYLRKLMRRQTEAVEDISEAISGKEESAGTDTEGSSYWGDDSSPYADTPPALDGPNGDGGGALEPMYGNNYDSYNVDSAQAGGGEFFRPGAAADNDDDWGGVGPELERVDTGTSSTIRPYSGTDHGSSDDAAGAFPGQAPAAPHGPGPQGPPASGNGGVVGDIPSPREHGTPYYGADGAVPPAAAMPDRDAAQPESDEPRVVPPSVDQDGGIVYTIYNPATGTYQVRDEREGDR